METNSQISKGYEMAYFRKAKRTYYKPSDRKQEKKLE